MRSYWKSKIDIEKMKKEGKNAGLLEALRDEDVIVRKLAAIALGEIRDTSAVTTLIQIMKENRWNEDIIVGALIKIGDLQSVELILDWLFKGHRPVFTDDTDGRKFSWPEENIFGDYAKYIEDLTCDLWSFDIRVMGHEYAEKLKIRSKNALAKLIKLDTPISTDLLHKLLQKQKKDISENTHFSSQCQNAKNELRRRGNPRYDPSAYLKMENWTITPSQMKAIQQRKSITAWLMEQPPKVSRRKIKLLIREWKDLVRFFHDRQKVGMAPLKEVQEKTRQLTRIERTIIETKDPIVEQLIQLLKEQEKCLQVRAIGLLGEKGDGKALEPLSKLLETEDWSNHERKTIKLAVDKIKAKKK